MPKPRDRRAYAASLLACFTAGATAGEAYKTLIAHRPANGWALGMAAVGQVVLVVELMRRSRP